MNWNLRYARGMDEESLNRLIPTTSGPINLNNDKNSFQSHKLDRPVGNLEHIITITDSTGMKAFKDRGAYLLEGYGKVSGWEGHANEALKRHFEEEPVDLPNKRDPHHPDNHQHILHRVKSWLASQM